MDLNKLCPHCLKEVEKINEVENCPHCGKNVKKISEVQHQLKPQTILAGKYLIGDVLGEGGFGITYVGFDLNLEMRVAIKEFYPNGYATREANATTALTVYSGQNQASVEKWRDSFIKEARSLAKCTHLSGVVGVKDFFQENNTAYIILEYLEGKTLKSYVKEQGGKVPVNMLLQALEPVIVSLGEVHKSGLIHRDISPDNIMLLPGGSMKLLDFGAARDYTESGEKSLSVMLKPGYAPEEQYRSKGVQGPWSDIYALCGTIYRCITGITPVESMERIRKDELKKPSELGIAIDSSVEAALMKGLAVFSEDRYQNIEDFTKDLYKRSPQTAQSKPVAAVKVEVPKEEKVSVKEPEKVEDKNKVVSEKPIVSTEIKSQIIEEKEEQKATNKKIYYIFGAVGLACLVIIIVLISTLLNEKSDKDTKQQIANKEETDIENIPIEDTNTTEDKTDEKDVTNTEPEKTEEISAEETQAIEAEKQAKYLAIHRYEIIISDVTWTQAYEDCISRGGYLVHINSEEEYKAITNQIRLEGKEKNTFWLGARRINETDGYHWINADGSYSDEEIDSKYWLPGEPSYVGTDENENVIEEAFVDMLYRSSEDCFYWNDVSENVLQQANYLKGKFGYICEYED